MAQAKRSPILGYNHNIKYRGVVFHVQTEDSGLLNPHLFTHLFHEGVIVQTRKLVYDAGSNEEAIKALMQAQHKAVMKDLKKGLFDEKIDQYLGGTPGLEPRAGEDPGVAAGRPRGERAKTELTPPSAEAADGVPQVDPGATSPQLEVIHDDLSEPIELPIKQRVQSDDRTRPMEMPKMEVAAAPPPQPERPVVSRTSTPQRGSRSALSQTPPSGSTRVIGGPARAGTPPPVAQKPPVIDISEEEIASRLRVSRDTAVDDAEGVPPKGSTPARPGAPAKPGQRSVPAIPARADARKRGDSESVEIYQPAPASAEPPPGERAERAGTYSVSRKSGDAPIREKTGRINAINAAAMAARPGTGSGASARDARVPQSVPREPTPGTATPRAQTPPLPGARPSTPSARPNVTAPIANRTSTPATPPANSPVIVTRPAVIVGAPPKTPPPSPPRVRKAREDEGRGFGQGLISEKSLDEVILAYLSEDADDK